MINPGQLRRRIAVFGLGLILAFVASSCYDAWHLHQQIERANERELGNLARALSEEAERSLQAVDLLLTDTQLWYRGDAVRMPSAAISAALASRVKAVPQVSVLTLVDAQGRQRYRSRDTGEPLADVADRPYFLVQRDHPATGMFINAPVITRSEGRPALVVSRRLQDPDGAFAGVVTAIVTLDDLRSVYGAIDLGRRSALLMAFEDGRLIVRQPHDSRAGIRDQYPELVALRNRPSGQATSPLDGRVKFVAVAGVSDRPLMMAVVRDQHDAMQPWREEMVSVGLRLLLMVLAALLTMILLNRQLLRVEAGERALRRSEERYALVLDAADEGYAEWNNAEKRCYASEKWKALHRIDAPLELKRIEDLAERLALHPDDRRAYRDALHDHLAGLTPEIQLEYRIRIDAAGGPGESDVVGWRWLLMRGRCARDSRGAPTRLFCTASDISPRKLAEAERSKLETQLRQSQHLEALGTLSGGIAHDFNNILGAILGHGEMAQRDAAQGSAQRRHLDRVMQAGARAKLLVRRILDFSRAGVRERELVHVQTAVDEALLLLAPSLPSGVRLITERNSGGAAIEGDTTQIHQLVSNLCTNALGAMPGGGILTVEVLRRQLTQPQALSHGKVEAGPVVCIRVRDTGTGISPEVYARMFDPFFSTKTVGEGTGLGLSVVHSIVADLGGALDVRTEPGAGSEFTLWLPVAGELQPASSEHETALPQGQGQVLMVVDDEEALLEFAEEMLAQLGYEPVGFSSSAAALRAFQADPGRFDAVLSDETMPGLSGVELVTELLRIRPDVPAVIMSGYGGEQLESKVLAAGARELLRKPLAMRDIAECLARQLAPVAQPA
ncbi:MAG: ATP-binding protein [Burkholderiaceae bacterium]